MDWWKNAIRKEECHFQKNFFIPYYRYVQSLKVHYPYMTYVAEYELGFAYLALFMQHVMEVKQQGTMHEKQFLKFVKRFGFSNGIHRCVSSFYDMELHGVRPMFHGNIGRGDAIEKLTGADAGSFLFRYSASREECLVISYVNEKMEFKHCLICSDEQMESYTLMNPENEMEEQHFADMMELISRSKGKFKDSQQRSELCVSFDNLKRKIRNPEKYEFDCNKNPMNASSDSPYGEFSPKDVAGKQSNKDVVDLEAFDEEDGYVHFESSELYKSPTELLMDEGKARYEGKEYEKAIQLFERVANSPCSQMDYIRALCNIGVSHLKLESGQLAFDFLKKVLYTIEQHPQHIVKIKKFKRIVLNNVVLACTMVDDKENALKYLNQLSNFTKSISNKRRIQEQIVALHCK